MRFALIGILAVAASAQDVIHLKSRTVWTGRDRQAHLSTPLLRAAGGSSHLLVQFSAESATESAAALEAAGVRLLRAVPDHAVLVASPDGFDWNSAPVKWVGRLRAADKISPAIEEQSDAFVVEFHPDIEAAVAGRILADAAVDASPNDSLLPGQVLIEAARERVERLAAWDEVAYIFPASEALRRGERVVACWGAISENLLVGQYVKVGTGWPMAGGALALNWSIASLTSKMTVLTAKAEIARALGEWAAYAPIAWTQTASPDAARTVKIIFRAMDGPGLMLAQTYYPAPPNPEPIAGDMHFDAAESWAAGRTMDLYSVALHEAGHALGLGHSDNVNAVMYPYYRQASGLSIDDINGIRDLYGSVTTVPPPPAEPPPVEPPPPEPVPPPVPSTDLTAPTLAITSPSTTVLSTTASAIRFAGTASDGVAVTRVAWEVSSGGAGTATGTSQWTVLSIPLRVGVNYVTIRAFDAAGNQSWRTVRVSRY